MKWLPRRIPVIVLVLLLALLLPLFTSSQYVLHIFVLLCVWVVLSLSLNFVTGFAGQLALGHSAFVVIGGYAGALVMLNFGVSFWIALFIGGCCAFLSGLILGLMSMRLRGDYLGMVTMGFAEIVRLLAVNLTDLTRGPMGLPGIPRVVIFGYQFKGELPYYYLIIGLMVLTYLGIDRLLFSRFGRACLAVRDDEQAAEAMGVKSYQYKVLAFCISSGFAGFIGVFYASWITLFSPDTFTNTDSVMMSAMITLGGIGSIFGPFVGGSVIGAIPEILRPVTSGAGLSSLRMAGVGLLMVVFLVLKPEGVFGTSRQKHYLSLDSLWNLFGIKPLTSRGGNHE